MVSRISKRAFFRLGERFAHHLNADAENLDVHLQSGNAAARARDLKSMSP